MYKQLHIYKDGAQIEQIRYLRGTLASSLEAERKLVFGKSTVGRSESLKTTRQPCALTSALGCVESSGACFELSHVSYMPQLPFECEACKKSSHEQLANSLNPKPYPTKRM